MSRIPFVLTLSGPSNHRLLEIQTQVEKLCEAYGLSPAIADNGTSASPLIVWASAPLTDEHLSFPEPSRSPRRSQRKKPTK